MYWAPAFTTSLISASEFLFKGLTLTISSDVFRSGFIVRMSDILCFDLTVFIPACRSSLPKVSKSIHIRSTPASCAIKATFGLLVIYINVIAIPIRLYANIVLEFAPDHLVDYTGVALNELDDFVGNVFVDVVGYGKTKVAVAVHFHSYIDCLEQ